MNFKKIASIAFALFAFICLSNAQQVTVNNPEAGNLKKQITKKDYANIIDLKITGSINDEDMMLLGKLVNLEVLDLSEVEGQMKEFPELPKLKYFTAAKNQGLSFDAQKNFIKCSQLCCLSFYQLSNIPSDFFGQAIPSLKVITINYDEPNHLRYNTANRQAVAVDTVKLSILDIAGRNTNELRTMQIESIKYIPTTIGAFSPKFIKLSSGDAINNTFNPDRTSFSDNPFLLQTGEEYYRGLSDVLDLSGVKWISARHFRGEDNVKKIIFSGDIEYIGDLAFENFEGLEEVVIGEGSGEVVIKSDAFSHCDKLSRITIGKKAVIEKDALKKVKDISFSAVPSFTDKSYATSLTAMISVPEGTKSQFVSAGFKSSSIIDGSADKEYNLKLDKGGTILSHLPLNDLTKVKSLTIVGVLYETDLQIISKCKNLEYLDLSQAYTTYSPEAAKKEKAEQEFYSGLFSLMSDYADAKYQNNETSTGEYVTTKILAELDKSSSEIKSNDPGCVIPFASLNGLEKLQALKLPYRLKEINNKNFQGLTSLKKIEWPLYLEYIGWHCFTNCTSLEEIKLPASVRVIRDGVDDGAFTGCSNLKLADFSDLTFEKTEWGDMFKGASKDLTIYLPKNIETITTYFNIDSPKSVYFPLTVKRIEYTYENAELHFAGETAPTAKSGDHSYLPRMCKIYSPKGSLTSYYTAFGGDNEGNEYFEERKENGAVLSAP